MLVRKLRMAAQVGVLEQKVIPFQTGDNLEQVR